MGEDQAAGKVVLSARHDFVEKTSCVQNRKLVEQAQELTGWLRVLSVSILIFSSANPPNRKHSSQERSVMFDLPLKLWRDEAGQDIAEYAVMLAVILVLVVGTVRLVGNNANNAFSSVASTIQ